MRDKETSPEVAESKMNLSLLSDALRLTVVARSALPHAAMTDMALLAGCRIIDRAKDQLE